MPPVTESPVGGARRYRRLRPTLVSVLLLAFAGSGCGAVEEAVSTDPAPSPSSVSTVTTMSRSVSSTSGTAAGSMADDIAAVMGDLVVADGDRFVEGSVEHMQWVGRCAELLGANVAVTVSPPAIFAAEGPTINRDGQVVQACLDAAQAQPWFVRYPFDGSIEGKRLQYRFELEIYQCLVANGYPTVEPPSEDAYVSGEADWSAYAAMGYGGVPLYVNPFLDPPPGSAERLEAQEMCGASLAVLYQDEILQPSP